MEEIGWMFDNADAFNQDIGISMEQILGVCHVHKLFNQDIGSWDVSNGIFGWMFYEADAFNQDISSWDVSRGNGFSEMFRNANAFNQI